MKYANEEMTHVRRPGSGRFVHATTGTCLTRSRRRPQRRGGKTLAIGAIIVWLGVGSAFAKLPPPTPEEQAAAAQKAEIAAAQVEKEKQALERVQDQLAARYGTGNRQPTPETEKKDLPKAVKEAPGDTGPKGGTKPSAEAHSAPVK